MNIPFDFDWKYYLRRYPDLLKAGLYTEVQARNHYRLCGYYEYIEEYKQSHPLNPLVKNSLLQNNSSMRIHFL